MAVNPPAAENFMIGAPDWSDNATLVASQAATGYPGSNLQTQPPSDKWRTSDVTSAITLTLDAGSAMAFNAVGLFNTNASEDASWRIRAANTEADLTANPSVDTASIFGPAVSCDGTTSTIGYAQFAAAIGSAWTVEMWVQVRVDPTQVYVWSLYHGGSGTPFLWVNSQRQFEVDDANSAGNGKMTSTTTIELGTWYHVAVAYGGTSASLIINGVEEDTATSISGSPWTVSEWISMPGANPTPFIGEVNDLRIWGKKRTASEVLADYQTVLAGSETDLDYYVPFTEGVGRYSEDIVNSDTTFIDSPLGVGFMWRYSPMDFWSTPDYDYFEKRHALWTSNPLGASAQWLRIDILDTRNSAGFFQAGRLMVCSAPQFQYNMRYGSGYGVRSTSRVRTGTTGVNVNTPGVFQRTFDLSVRMFRDSDYEQMFNLLNARGNHYDLLFVRDPTGTSRVNQFAMQCRVSASQSRIRHQFYEGRDIRLPLEEIV